MNKKYIAIMLCISMLLSIFVHAVPVVYADEKVPVTYTDEKIIDITHEGKTVTNLIIAHTDKEILTAQVEGIDVTSYQWQILLDPQNSIWVNIYDKKQQDCEFSYAVVKNMLDAANSTYIRCAVSSEEEIRYSDPVCIEISFIEDPVQDVEVPKILLKDMYVITPGQDPMVSGNDAGSDVWNVSGNDSGEEVVSGNGAVQPTTGSFMQEQQAMFSQRSLVAADLQARDISVEYVTITIKYLDISSLDGEEMAIYSPYTATIEKGSSFHQNVVSPTFLGFAPYYDNDTTDADASIDDDASTIVLNLNEVNEDMEFKVYYKPIEVDFAVRYFFQNIHDDLYTENISLYHTGRAETGTIISDEYLRKYAGTTDGFEKMYHIPESVAADGSTVFECYYDRNYYLVQFDLNGGYGVDPIYARYGTPFVVNDPVRHGYNFKGWDRVTVDSDGDGVADSGNGIVDELPAVIPAENQKYVAVWETVDTTYTVVYWRENADDNGYTYWGNAKKNATSSSYVNGEDDASADGMVDAVYFEFNSALSDKNVLVEGDGSTVVNVYYTRKYYTITFKASGACTIPAGHIHGDECYDYICESSQHIHKDDCLVCMIPVHIHGESCCVIKEHTHSGECCTIVYHVHDDTCCTKEEHTQHDEECCMLEEHTQHDTSCWSNIGNVQNNIGNVPNNPEQGQITRKGNRGSGYTYYIYIGTLWYRYNGTINNYNDKNPPVINPTCGKAIHSHGDGSCTCATEIHTHGDGDCTCLEAYHNHLGGDCNVEMCPNGGAEHTHGIGNCTCAETAHAHTEDCYNCGATEHTHTDECKRLICGIPEGHTHTSACTNSSSTNTVKIVYRKYQQSIEDLWPVVDDNGKQYDSGERWDPSDSSYYDQVLVYISSMPPDDFTLTLNESNASTKTMNYYLQVLPGDEYDVEYSGNQYKLHDTIRANYNYITKAEDFFDIKGFVQYASDPTFSNNQINASTADFYYNRITDHVLQFNNNGTLLADKEVNGIMYGASLMSYNFMPVYPSNLEPNAYYFGGWYTSPGCYDGTEVNWDMLTMPEGDLLLYAKWIPQTHKVNFFITLDDMNAYEADSSSIVPYKTYEAVTHGTVVGSVDNPDRTDMGNMSLIFAGWFYIENGQKKAFAPLDMPINGDINVFADWSSHSPQPYRIRYVLLTDPTVEVAEETTGFAYGGSTRTFAAKAGDPYNQLFDEYNAGYYPTVSSHSITMQYEEDKGNPVINVYTFYYVKASHIKYTIRYVNKENNTLLEEETVKTTEAAVVTERFKAFENMVPDAFYKRLVISVEWDEEEQEYVGTEDNVITFYYTPNTTSAYYAVHYMLEKLDATDAQREQYYINGTGGYEETGTHVEGIGDVGKDVEIIPQTFSGFALIPDQALTVVGEDGTPTSTIYTNDVYTIKVTESGTELYIFYKRLKYNYKVHYYLYNTTTLVDSVNYPSETAEAYYGSTVTKEAKKISGFTCVSLKEQSRVIRDDEDQNTIIFYYSPVQYVAEYVAVSDEGGWLSNTIEVRAGTEDFVGSTPTANLYYKFEGWYLDEECTQPVTDENGTVTDATGHFKPDKSKLSETERNIFYAKFVRMAGDLTISRSGADEDGQVFVYEVKNNTSGEIIYVTVVGNGSVTIHDITFGQYTVTQQNSWSWRYGDIAATGSHNNVSGTTFHFSTPFDTNQWLNGNSTLIKNQRG